MPDPIRLAVFFTWDVSLSLWQSKGLLEREVRFYQALVQAGVDVTFLTWGGEEETGIAALIPEITVVPLYTRIPRPRNKALRSLCSLLAPWAARDILKKTDIIKTNQMWGGWCAALAHFMFGKKLIVRTGYELYQFTVNQGHGWFRQKFIWLISALTYQAANQIFLATPEDRDFVVRHFYIRPEKIAIRPNWIDTEVFRPIELAQESGTILYVGRLTPQKNLDQLIEAIAGTPYTLDIIGEGELKETLRRRAVLSGANVNFLGSVANSELPALYNRYPVFVLPSLYEGNPKTLLEAMACGRAVLGAESPGIASVIDDGKSGLLCPHDAQGMRAKIDLLMKDPALRQSLGQEARRQIENTQTLYMLMNKELKSYRSLME